MKSSLIGTDGVILNTNNIGEFYDAVGSLTSCDHVDNQVIWIDLIDSKVVWTNLCYSVSSECVYFAFQSS